MPSYDTDDEGENMPLYDLDDVCSKLDDIETAIKSHTETTIKPHTGADSALWLIFGAFFFFYVVPALFYGASYSKTRYVVEYGVSYDQVILGKEPDDCNFMHSPIGRKGCHYDVQVSTVKVQPNRWGGQSISYDEGKTWIETATSTNGYPIVSTDGGKTWSGEDVPPHADPQVLVSWEKKDGD